VGIIDKLIAVFRDSRNGCAKRRQLVNKLILLIIFPDGRIALLIFLCDFSFNIFNNEGHSLHF